MLERGWSVARLVLAGLTLVAVGAVLAHVLDQRAPVSNFVSYFTIQSNVLAAGVLGFVGTTVLRGRDPDELASLRGAATLYMTVTGIVYVLLLRGVDVQTPEPWNSVLHYLMPVVMLLDWLAFPPRRVPAYRRALWWLAYPVAYLLYSLVRGAVVDWYPYPFLDPADGYPGVLVVSAAMLLVAAGLVWALLRAAAARTRREVRRT